MKQAASITGFLLCLLLSPEMEVTYFLEMSVDIKQTIHSVTSQKTQILITTAVRTLNPTQRKVLLIVILILKEQF
jgi:hypothetical protein